VLVPPPYVDVAPRVLAVPEPAKALPLPTARFDDEMSALEHAREHAQALRRSLDSRPDDLELRKALTQAIGQLRHAERDEETRMARVLRSPEWKSIEGRIVDAIRPFGPDALRAVARALQGIKEEPQSKAA
jgi:hypothetical protein